MPSLPADVGATLLEGEISIGAALNGRYRAIERILIATDKPRTDTRELEQLASRSNVKIERAPRTKIDELAHGNSHGGVIAFAGDRQFVSLDALLLQDHPAFIVMLDGIEDPFNFGQAVRALYAAGADGLVVRPRNWTCAAAIVARASAGASELMPMALADDPQVAAAFFKPRSLGIAVTARDRRATSLYDADFAAPIFLVIGGEKRGISRAFMDEADLLLRVPYKRKFPHSLGSAAAAAVIAFEVMRQRFMAKAKTQS